MSIEFLFQSFVHVSTAYSNADKREVREGVYIPPLDPRVLLECVDSLPNDVISSISKKILVSSITEIF